MKKVLSISNQSGFSLAEIVVAVAIFGLLVGSVTTVLLTFSKSVKFSGEKNQAVFLAEEGLEAVRNIRDAGFANLTDGTFGLSTTTGQWTFFGTSDNTGIYNRRIDISTVSANQKQITATTNWQQNGVNRSVSASTFLTNWASVSNKGGMLVYGNGTTTSDQILYTTFDSASGWSAPAQTADVDGSTSNRALRAALLYSSPTRNEKVLLSRHYNGTTQYIYAQVYNGNAWGNVQILGSWNATTFLDVRNFSGTYLNNGDFMVVYSDNTTTPKFRTWNGSVWSSETSLRALTAVPVYIKISARPSSNEVMAAFFDASQLTKTEYYNGLGYLTTNWTNPTSHGTGSSSNTRDALSFGWLKSNPLKGALVYSGTSNDRKLTIKIATADGSGAVSWGSAAGSTPTQPSGRAVGSIDIDTRTGADEIIACDKDVNASSNIYCYESNLTPTWVNPTNQTLASPTDNGIQKSFDLAYETSGGEAIGVYSDTTSVPKLKIYYPTTNSWTSTSTNLSTLSAGVETVSLKSDPSSDNILILMADNSRKLYTAFWDGANNQLFTSPGSMNLVLQGSNGSAVIDYWYDFAWDQF